MRARLRALRYPKDVVEDVARLTLLHLRFHGYGRGEWTDSAVRRYVTDAGPLLPRLHKLVRSDCTTRNKRRAAALARSYDAAGGADRPDRGRGGPARGPARTWTATRSWRSSGCRPGPLVGQAWRYLKELRLDRGPLPHDEAVAELQRWAADQESRPSQVRRPGWSPAAAAGQAVAERGQRVAGGDDGEHRVRLARTTGSRNAATTAAATNVTLNSVS